MNSRKILTGAAVFAVGALTLLGLWSLLGRGSAGTAFMPHATSYLWNKPLMTLHVVSDLLIGSAYIAISTTLAFLVIRARRQIPFQWMFLAFGAFIIACGVTHLMEVWTVWEPRYWLAGNVKLVTAIASVATAVVLPPLVPKVLGLLRSARLSEERKRRLEAANVELTALYEKVKELDTLKTDFFANVSHELRTPLALIFGPIDHLLNGRKWDAVDRRHLEMVQRNALILHSHVNDLLDLSKLEAGKMRADLSRIDLADTLRLGAGCFESISVDRRVELEIEAPESLPLMLDAEKIQRVITNLLTNALKFTPPEGRIRCSLAKNPGEVELRIEDSGPGVPPAERERIFDRFRQAEPSSGHRFGGTGLGLAIVKEYVELHQGSVHVEESGLGGAAFVIRVPVIEPGDNAGSTSWNEETAQAAVETLEAELGVHSKEPAEQAGETSEQLRLPIMGLDSPPTSKGKPLVLVAEDNPEMNRFMTGILSAEFRVCSAFDGHEALRLALEEKPDLVLTDMMMPRMSGEELIRRMSEHESLRGVPVILVTARAEDDLKSNLLNAGAHDFIRKPFGVQELLVRVRNQITAKRVRDTLQSELASHTHDIDKLALEIAVRTRALSQAKEAAESASHAKDQFLAVLSHELRTPLTPVLMAATAMEQSGDLSPGAKNSIRMIRRNIELEARLIDDLLDLTRAARNKLQLELETFDLHALLQSAVEITEADVPGRSPRVQLDLAASRHYVRGDWPRLLQVFWNLIQNSLKFTPPEGEIWIRTRTEDGHRIRVEVSDTGLGIQPATLPRVFEAFEQGRPEVTRRFGGLGLGLSVARSLVEAHGGTIAAASEGVGRGTTLTVELETTDSVSSLPPEESSDLLETPARGLRMLFVEDHADTRETTLKILRRWGHEVEVAETFESASRILEADGFDVLLTDVGLPDGDGTNLLPIARRHHPGVVGIAVSGFGMEKDLEASREAGFAEHIIKPVALGRLKTVLESIQPDLEPRA